MDSNVFVCVSVTVMCTGEEAGRGLKVNVECTASHDITTTACSLDGSQPTECMHTYTDTLLSPIEAQVNTMY